MFCVKCGKEAVVNNFCNECFLGRNELFTIKDFVLFYCDNCKKYFDAGSALTIEDAIERRIKTDNLIKTVAVETKILGNKVYTNVICSGLIKPCKKMKTEEKKSLIIIRKLMCETCKRLSGNYYEAVIQVRGDSEKIMSKIKYLSKNAIIAGVKEVKTGYDIRFVSKSQASSIAKALRDDFHVKSTCKLVGEKKGKRLYRNFYAVR